MAKLSTDRRNDWGLFALRMIALFLLVTVGWEKFQGLVNDMRAGKPLAASGLAPLIGKLGFPLPALLGLMVALNESVGAFLISCGLFTRLAAFSAAMGMLGAFYTTVHFGWEPLRAFMYFVVFTTLVFTGAGRFSLDAKWLPSIGVATSIDTGLLMLRVGMAASLVMLLTLTKASSLSSFARGPAAVLLGVAVLLAAGVLVGFLTRQCSLIAAALWAFAAICGLISGQKWDLLPYRDAMFAFLFVVLAISGPGRFSVEGLRRGR